MEDAFRIRLHESAVPVAGAREMLEHLHGKYRLCAASNGPYAQQVNRLRARGCMIFRDALHLRADRRGKAEHVVFLTAAWSTCPGYGRSSAS